MQIISGLKVKPAIPFNVIAIDKLKKTVERTYIRFRCASYSVGYN